MVDQRGAVRLVRAGRLPVVPGWALAVVLGWLGLVGLGEALKASSGVNVPSCAFRLLTGVPCPTCGSTRAVLAAGQTRFLAALLYNPLLTVAAMAGLAWLLLRLGFGRTIQLDLAPRGRAIVWIAAGGLVALNWAYVIVASV